MLLSYHELHDLIKSGVIDADPENVNGTSIDVRLDRYILVERKQQEMMIIDPTEKQSHETMAVDLLNESYVMQPGQCVLASTMETFNLPNNISCEFKLKSSIARVFLNNMLATYCDPGWRNSKLTLELKNDLQYNAILLSYKMKIGQMIFLRSQPVPEDRSYKVRGRYNNTTIVTASKGV